MLQKGKSLRMTAPLIENFGAMQAPKSESLPFLNSAEFTTRCCILEPVLKDWIELLAALDAAGIRYLVVGGIAVGFHAEPRFTKDLDVLIHVRRPDQEKLYQVLKEYGAPISILSSEEFLQEDFVFHFGVPPWRIDILTSIPGVDFEKAYLAKAKLPLGTYQADCISKDWLIIAKRASGRPQDLLDLKSLDA